MRNENINFRNKDLIETIIDAEKLVNPIILCRYQRGNDHWVEQMLTETQFRAVCVWRKHNPDKDIKIQVKSTECKNWITIDKDGYLKKEFTPNAKGFTPISVNPLLSMELLNDLQKVMDELESDKKI